MNTTATPNGDTLRSQMNVENRNPDNNNSTELITKEEVEGTPFTIVGNEKGYWLALGIIRLSDNKETKEDVQQWLTNNTWTIVTYIVGGMIELNNKYINKHPISTNNQNY